MGESVPGAAATADALLARARRTIEAAGNEGLPMRLLGGLAVYALTESARHPPLARTYRDFDVAVPARQGRAASKVLVSQGFAPEDHFNALHGARRMIFHAPDGYDVDVLIGTFVMCHQLDIESGFGRHSLSIAPADLLLTKLQIVRIEPKDLGDAAALLLDMPPAEDGIDLDRFAAPLAQDWGFFHTVELNLPKVRRFARETLSEGEAARIGRIIDELALAMERVPKQLRWRIRSRVGERVVWYEEPEDVE
jgi:hypothetical protein